MDILSIKEIKFIIFKSSKKKYQIPDGSTGEFYQTFKKISTDSTFLIQNTEVERTFPTPFYEDRLTLVPKPDKDNF